MIKKPFSLYKHQWSLFIKIHKGVQFNFFQQKGSASTMCFVNGERIFDCALSRNSPMLYDSWAFDTFITEYSLTPSPTYPPDSSQA